MKAFLSIKYHPDGHNRARIEHISAAFARMGWESLCVVRDIEAWGERSYSPQELMRLTFSAIDGCDLVAVELSEKGVGVGIEAGYAHARGKPILTLAQHGCPVSDTLRGISRWVVAYDDPQLLAGQLAFISQPGAFAEPPPA